MDRQGRDVENGEIVVRGPRVLKGYRGNPEETAAIAGAGLNGHLLEIEEVICGPRIVEMLETFPRVTTGKSLDREIRLAARA